MGYGEVRIILKFFNNLLTYIRMQKIRTMRGHKGSISCLQAGAGKTCISASYDNTL